MPQVRLPRHAIDLSAFYDTEKVLRTDFSLLQGIFDADPSTGMPEDEQIKRDMNAMALANHFLNVNSDVLGPEAKSMTTFAAAIGCTSMGKDTTCAQIVEKKELAVWLAQLLLQVSAFVVCSCSKAFEAASCAKDREGHDHCSACAHDVNRACWLLRAGCR